MWITEKSMSDSKKSMSDSKKPARGIGGPMRAIGEERWSVERAGSHVVPSHLAWTSRGYPGAPLRAMSASAATAQA